MKTETKDLEVIQEVTTAVLPKTMVVIVKKLEETSFTDKTTKEVKTTPEHYRIIVPSKTYGKPTETEIKLINPANELDNYDFSKIMYKPVSLNNMLVSSMVRNNKVVKYYRMDLKDIRLLG